MSFETFDTWPAVLAHIAAGLPTYYHAPLDYQPVRVRCELRRGSKVRVFPPTRDADPFTCGSAHLDRFKRQS